MIERSSIAGALTIEGSMGEIQPVDLKENEFDYVD